MAKNTSYDSNLQLHEAVQQQANKERMRRRMPPRIPRRRDPYWQGVLLLFLLVVLAMLLIH